MNTVKFTNYTLEQLTQAVSVSICWSDVCKTLKICYDVKNVDKIRKLVLEHALDVSHFDARSAMGRNKKINKRKGSIGITYTIDELDASVQSSQCWSDVCRYLRISVCTHNINRTRELCKTNNINTTHFNVALTRQRNKVLWTHETLFVKDCDIPRSSLRPVLIRWGEYTGKCAECNSPDVWNGKPLTIEIDHVNGDHRDNRRENLRWLCPNCHSQTLTYRRKRPAE